jgi:hypothetical protein
VYVRVHLLRAQSASHAQARQNFSDRQTEGFGVLGDELAAFLCIFYGIAGLDLAD